MVQEHAKNAFFIAISNLTLLKWLLEIDFFILYSNTIFVTLVTPPCLTSTMVQEHAKKCFFHCDFKFDPFEVALRNRFFHSLFQYHFCHPCNTTMPNQYHGLGACKICFFHCDFKFDPFEVTLKNRFFHSQFRYHFFVTLITPPSLTSTMVQEHAKNAFFIEISNLTLKIYTSNFIFTFLYIDLLIKIYIFLC